MSVYVYFSRERTNNEVAVLLTNHLTLNKKLFQWQLIEIPDCPTCTDKIEEIQEHFIECNNTQENQENLVTEAINAFHKLPTIINLDITGQIADIIFNNFFRYMLQYSWTTLLFNGWFSLGIFNNNDFFLPQY